MIFKLIKPLNNVIEASNQIHGADVHTCYYTGSVRMVLVNRHLSWTEEAVLNSPKDNWEGLIPFEDGVLLIVDGIPPGFHCKLSYFKIN